MKVYKDEQTCVQYLERIRWNGLVISPFDKNSKVYKCKNGYKCHNTQKYFNVKHGTIFQGTKKPLQDWFVAFWLVTVAKKGITSIELGEQLGVHQPQAYRMLMKIRSVYKNDNDGDNLGEDSVYEVDEKFIGGRNPNRHRKNRFTYSKVRTGKYPDKATVFGILDRNGKMIAKVVKNARSKSLIPLVHKYAKEGSTIISDDWNAYKTLKTSYVHEIVEHAKGTYVKGEFHTNTIEGAWNIVQKTIIGTHNQVTQKRLQVYIDEIMFKINYRSYQPFERWGIGIKFAFSIN